LNCLIYFRQWNYPFDESLAMEGSEGSNSDIIKEAIEGAALFSSGQGRKGAQHEDVLHES
jgi:hypothetical protein